ncbi:hypothetical protein PRIPAC_92311 [Pristionchus pacificus]|uniref:Uncharacterized protein n=1 Tax=Pristionchus pacificus TaxID=54126 RepID=A0A2A6BQZ4_PRIPA|nr:hypothetical protein PRIPAC_92311 [Pristionchus pacificus]|eukprot:PDM68288.1 hypothetical protein PRIPAC_46332 [Pristionchus pacificus]
MSPLRVGLSSSNSNRPQDTTGLKGLKTTVSTKNRVQSGVGQIFIDEHYEGIISYYISNRTGSCLVSKTFVADKLQGVTPYINPVHQLFAPHDFVVFFRVDSRRRIDGEELETDFESLRLTLVPCLLDESRDESATRVMLWKNATDFLSDVSGLSELSEFTSLVVTEMLRTLEVLYPEAVNTACASAAILSTTPANRITGSSRFKDLLLEKRSDLVDEVRKS